MISPRSSQPNGAEKQRPDILVITSQVVRGSIGGRGAVFALERLGYTVWFVPTILLPWQPELGKGTRIVASDEGFSQILNDLAASDGLKNVGAVISGYLGAPTQAAAIAELVAATRKANPNVLYVCDPVIGDMGGLYVPEETAAAIRDTLIPLADISTPNAFELSWLTGLQADAETQTIASARALGPDRVLVTSAPALRRNSVSNLLVTPSDVIAAEHGLVPNAPHGTGDLISALFIARLLEGHGEEGSLKRAAASTFELVARSVKQGAEQLLVVSEQASILGPMALVSSRRVLDKPRRA